jgi:hypothetical protein
MDSLFIDLDSGLINPVSSTLPVPAGSVNFSEWLKVDRFEQAQGIQHGKTRDKVRSVGEMIRIAKE